jgi:hypothetical protein
MFFAPIIGMVPPEATAPALITVGFLMMTALTEAEEEAEIEQAAEEGEPPPPARGAASSPASTSATSGSVSPPR